MEGNKEEGIVGPARPVEKRWHLMSSYSHIYYQTAMAAAAAAALGIGTRTRTWTYNKPATKHAPLCFLSWDSRKSPLLITGPKVRVKAKARGRLIIMATETEKLGIKIVKDPPESTLSDLGVRSWPKSLSLSLLDLIALCLSSYRG